MMNNFVEKYDLIFADELGMQQYVTFLKPYLLNKNILELASGTGDLYLQCKDFCNFTASDYCIDMVEKMIEKGVINSVQCDMRSFSLNSEYNVILCLGDSFNYLKNTHEVKSMFRCVYSHLSQGGTFIFDMHHINRLFEFQKPFVEEGKLHDFEYGWQIESSSNCIIHQISLYTDHDTHNEVILQTVYEEDEIETFLYEIGFKFIKKYDFNQNRSNLETEKVFYICKKEI